MTMFVVLGEYTNEDGIGEHGIVTVVPSSLPLVSRYENEVITDPIVGKINRGIVRVELPAQDAYDPAFSLTWIARLNSGRIEEFEFMPFGVGDVVRLRDITEIPAPLPIPDKVEYSAAVLAARDEAEAARDEARHTLNTILAIDLPDNGLSAYELAVLEGFNGTQADWLASLRGPAGEITQYPIDEVVDEVLEDLEPPVDLVLHFENVLSGGMIP